MAKKYEFQPDKPHSDWRSRLQLTPQQRRALLKWCLYAVILLVVSLVQDVVMCRFRFWGVSTDLMPCAIFLIALLEGSQRGSIFSLVAGTMYLFTGTAPGAHCMVAITVIAIIVTIFRQAYLEPGLPAAILCIGAAMVVYELVIYGVCILMGQVRYTQVTEFLIIAGITLAAVPVLYPICKAINKMGGNKWKE